MTLKSPRFNLALIVALFATSVSAQAFTLDATTHIVITETGELGNAGGAMTDTISKYLLAALRRDSLEGGGDTVTIILDPQYAQWQDIPRDKLTSITDIDSYTITIEASPQPRVHIQGKTAMATGFGMMDFLENDIGVTWLFPGDLGVALPDSATINLEPGSRTARPAIASRILSGHLYRNPDYGRKYTVYDGVLGGSSGFFKAYDYFKAMKPHMLAYSSHALMHVFPPDKIVAEYPHIQPLVNGERLDVSKVKTHHGKPFHSWQPCYAEEDTYKLAIAWAREKFEAGGYMISLGVNDGKNTLCECDHCAKIGWPHNYYHFVNRVAEACADYYPPRMIGVIAYGSAGQPPEGMTLRDNVSVTVIAHDTERFQQWSKIAQHLAIYEYLYGVWYWLPQLPLDAMASNARFYRDNNVEAVYAEAYPLWAFDGPKLYIRWKLMWDPELDVHAALRRYCQAAFGAGAEPMVELYEHWAAKNDYYHNPDGLSPMCDMYLRQRPAAQFARCTEADYVLTDALLVQARNAATTEAQRARIDMVDTFFDYSHTLNGLFKLSDKLSSRDAAIPVIAAQQEVAALTTKKEALVARMAAHDEWFVGTSSDVDMITGDRWQTGDTITHEIDVLLKAMTYTAAQTFGPDARELDGLPDDLRRYASPESSEPKKIHIRKKHPWYARDIHEPMNVQEQDKVITFTPATDGEPIDPNKTYWASLLLIGEPIDGKTAFVFDFDLVGADGVVQLSGHVGSNNRGMGVFTQTIPLRATGETTRKRFILEPMLFDGKTGQYIGRVDLLENGEYNKSNLELFVLFMPNTKDATLTGTLNVQQLKLP